MSDKVLSEDIFESYGGDEQRLYSYSTLMGVFNLIFAAFLLVVKAAGRPIPERVDAKDIALLGVATHKLSQIGAKDAVTSPLRAPPFHRAPRDREPEERPRGASGRRP